MLKLWREPPGLAWSQDWDVFLTGQAGYWPSEVGRSVAEFVTARVMIYAQLGKMRLTVKMNAGHTFVVQADLGKLACDLVLLPTDEGLDVRKHWTHLGQPRPPSGWSNSGVRVTDAVPECGFGQDRLVRWVNTGSIPSLAKVQWLLEGVRQALDAAGRSVSARPPLNARTRPLVGLPLFGTGAGGFDALRGEVLDGILAECDAATARYGYDLVITCRLRSDYAALQARRRRQNAGSPAPHGDLLAEAERLGKVARTGGLALFLGAGISQPAGLPSWTDLIRRLAKRSRSYADRPDELLEIPAIDAALLLERDLGPQFRESLRLELSRPLHAVGHALLASLRTAEAITTNFDALYEQACAATFDERPRKLPWQRAEPGRPWLLKMHGDVDSENLVLSRDEFLGYDTLWRPLASMVQTAMMTRHVLFVGFSLNDENFVRLGRDVSLLLDRMKLDRVVGTVLTLRHEPMLTALWGEDLRHVAMATPETDSPAASRLLDIFLDHVAMNAASDERSYLLDSRYAALVDDADRAVMKKLTELGQAVGNDDDRWRDVSELLKRYGYR